MSQRYTLLIIIMISLLQISQNVTPPDFCSKYDPKTVFDTDNYVCLQCQSGYFLFVVMNVCFKLETQTTAVQTSGTIAAPPIQKDQNCKTFATNDQCLECFLGYYYNTIQGRCMVSNPYCKTISSEGNCLTCFLGYKVEDGQCALENSLGAIYIPTKPWVPPVNPDPFCLRYENGICLQCSYRYYFSSSKRCVEVNADCRSWDTGSGLCTGCYSGFALSNGICTIAPVTKKDPNCLVTSLSSGLCTKCSYRYYFDNANNICKMVSDNCQTWSSVSGQCLSCYGGYYLSTGQCLIITPSNNKLKDPYCFSFQGDICVQCYDRYFINAQKKCELVNFLCKKYNTNGQCTECFTGFKISSPSCIPA